MTKLIEVAFALAALFSVAFIVAAFGASLSPAFAGPQGAPVVHDATLVDIYVPAAPIAPTATKAPTAHYSDAETYILNRNSSGLGR